ncbi:hypothetical protein BS78_01G285400 [Paspalum vaginatum]|nr:hypothetical protein BS78_01G285400 [Paspalum vaginatum]
MGRAGFRRKCKSRKLGADQEPRHRASPFRIIRMYPHLTPEQRKMIEDAGFGGLLKIACPTFPLRFCGWLLQRFDTDDCELVIKGRGRIPVTSESVHRVLGIPNSGGDVKYGLDADSIAFMTDKFGVSSRYSPTIMSIEKSLKEMKSADEHFLRTFMVFVISSFLCPTTGLRISPRCFPPLVNIGSIRELDWCKFVVERLRKSVSAYGRRISVPGCLFYLVILYLDSLDTCDTQIPDGTPRISVWNKKLVNKVIKMDMKNDGSFGKCLLKKRSPDNTKSRGASSSTPILGGVPEIANFVSANVADGYNAQKKEVLCNAVGQLCASITNALSKFMHEVSTLEGSSGEVTARDHILSTVENNNVDENDTQGEEDVLPEDSSELPTEDLEDTSADEYEDESSVDGGSTDDSSEDDPDWEQDELNSSKQKRGKTEHRDGVTKSGREAGKGSGHDLDAPQEKNQDVQETGNGCSEENANYSKRASAGVDADALNARNTRQKTGEKSGAIVEKTTAQPNSSSLHSAGRPFSSCLKLRDDRRPLKVEEDTEEKTPVIDLCTSSSSDS